MGVRTFIIENANGDSINLTENIDLFAFSPEGLGIEIENDLISSGGSFLVNKREITPGELTLSLLLGALQENPYGAYSRFIDVLSKPPYILRYKTPVGEWSRSCVLSALSKSEINTLNVMTEQVKFQFTTPWFRYVYNEYPVPPTQLGDGKIYNKHTNWIYATDGYKSAPLTGYKLNEYWTYDQSVIFPGRNIANNMYYDQLEISGATSKDIFTVLSDLAPKDAIFVGFEADIEIVSLSSTVRLQFDNVDVFSDITQSTKHVRATGSVLNGNRWVLSLAGMKNPNDRIIFKNLYISYATQDNTGIMEGRFSEPLYWNARDMNILGRQDGAGQQIFITSDGNSDARLNYSVIPANYPRHKPYIYDANYDFDYKFTDWYVTADKISIDSLELTAGQLFNYSAYFGNSPNSEANLSVRMIFLKGGQQMSSIESGVSITRGNYDMVKMDNVILPTGATHIEIQIYKTGDTRILNMGATYSAKRMFVNDLEPVLLIATKTNSILVESDWILAEHPEKIADSVHYGYIYNYVYDGDKKAANTYLIENNSLYVRTKVNSPCEITIHGPAKNPRWEVLIDSQVTMTDGFNLTIPIGWRLIVSSFPNEQRAILVDPSGVESNVYQQQILSYTNFVRVPPGLSILMVYGADSNVDFRYREERDVV